MFFSGTASCFLLKSVALDDVDEKWESVKSYLSEESK